MKRAEYDAIDAVNWSTLKYIGQSPLHYKHRTQANDRPDTIYLRLGRFVHAMVLEPADYVERHFVVYRGNPKRPAENPKRAGKFFEDWRAEQPDDIEILIPSEYETGLAMASAVMEDTAAREALHGVKETPVFWTDEETGLECKAIPDAVNGRQSDLKTANARDYHPDRFWRQAQRFQYHGQLAHYRAGLEANGYQAEEAPALVVVESTAPFDVCVYRVPEAMMSEGERLRRALLETLQACRKDNFWPGVTYGQEVELFWPEMLAEGVTFGGKQI